MRRQPLIFSLLLLALSARGEAPPSPKVIERYKQMLAENPTEGTALERLWKIYVDQGQTGQLLDEYKAGGSFASQMIFGHLLRRAGRLEEAVTAFQAAAKLDEKSPLPLLALARVESERSHPREAAEHYNRAAALLAPNDPRLPETLMQLGAAWLEAGDVTKAAEAWERTVALNPTDLELHRRLAEAYERNFLPDRAIEHLSYLEAHSPAADRPLALQQMARIHQGAGRQDAAIAALEKALALTGPGNWLRNELESQIIRLHQRYHRTAELEARWIEYARQNPRDLGACLQLIELYERTGNLEEQRVWLEAAIVRAPKNADYRVKLARLLAQMDQPGPASAIYDALLKEQPANADFVFERARIDVQRDSTPAAKERIAALLVARKNDETIRAKALEFYGQNRLFDLVEEHLKADAASSGEEPLVALATFYFTQHRDAEARRTLQRLVNPTDLPAKQAGARARIAQILRGQNDLANAIAELEKAVALKPGTRDFHLALGDLKAARGEYPAAQSEYEKAVLIGGNEAERTEADQKLFESFRGQVQTAAPNPRPGRPLLPFALPGSDPGAPEPNPPLDKFLAAMERDAVLQISEAAWLRVARWRLWNRDNKAALIAAEKAIILNPKSVAAYELLVKLEGSAGPSPAVVRNLMELARIDPPNRASYERRAGQVELQAGRISEALAIFERLAQESPGSIDALSDLALTQQRAERWPEALATWRQVYALSPVSRRKEAFTPLLRVLERLDLHQQSAELQLKAVETEANDREQLALFNDLLTHCGKHGLLDWLRAQFEKRRKLRADDYFTEIALGRILKAAGDAAGAFEVLADASYAAPNQAEALPELIREAEDLHKIDAAVKLQAQLLRIVPQESPDGFEKLAQLQEKNFEIDEAAHTWERVVAKFPRDTTALNHAVDFQMAWGTSARAIALLRKARVLDPSNLQTLSTLSTLDLEAGAIAEARDCLEQILRITPSEKPGDPLRFPAVKTTEAGRLQTAYLATVGQRNGRPTPEAMRALRSFWVEETPETKGERNIRLNAIRQLAELIQTGDAADREAWIERWRKNTTAPSEALWALFHAGAGAATLDRVEALMKDNATDPKAAQAFIWLALRSGEYDRLGAWLKDKHRTPSERDYLFVILGQALDAGGIKADPRLIDALFADGTHLRLWQAALLFAGRNRFAEAIRLGRRVFENATTQRAAYGQELAHWQLYLGHIEEARATLLLTIGSTAESFDAPVCGALRDYYLLLPASERAAFLETYLGRIDRQQNPLHAAISETLLHGLAGHDAETRAALDRLIDMRAMAGLEVSEPGTSGTRHLRFLLETGTQLQALKLEKYAAYFWEKAVADEALLQLQGDQAAAISRDLRQRLCALRVATLPPSEMRPWLDTFARLSPNEGLAPLAAALGTLGAHARSIALYRQIWERDPGDPEALRNLLNECRAAGDNESAESALVTSLSDTTGRMNDGARREFMLQLTDLLERRNDFDRATTILSRAVENTPNDSRLLLRLAQVQERANRAEQAVNTYQRLLVFEPGNVAARVALSSLYAAQNRLSDALALFKNASGPDVDARLAQLQFESKQPEIALTTIERIPPPLHIAPALSLASAFAAKGDRTRARVALQSALSRTTDPLKRFPLQCKLIELLTPEDGALAAERELRRLRRLANEGQDLLGSYFDFAAQQSARLHLAKEFAAEVRTRWADGAGPIPAGVAALTAQLEAGDKSAAGLTLDQLLRRDDVSEAWLQTTSEALEKAGLREALARVQQRMTEVNPLNDQNALNLARTLAQLGRKEDARARLETLALRATLNEDNLGRVAAGFLDLGDTARARSLYAQAASADRFARNWTTLIQYARLQTQQRDFTGAKKTLRTAFSNPANRSFNEIIDWLVAAGRLDRLEEEAADFELTAARQVELRRTLFGYFEKAGQPANALALAEAHSEILQPGMGARLRKLAAAGRVFEAVASLLENLAAETSPPGEFSVELARLYGDWAQAELAAAQPEPALGHLRTAHERHPELLDVTLRLSRLQHERGDRKGAIETIESFLAVAKISTEIEQAREQLARLKAGG